MAGSQPFERCRSGGFGRVLIGLGRPPLMSERRQEPSEGMVLAVAAVAVAVGYGPTGYRVGKHANRGVRHAHQTSHGERPAPVSGLRTLGIGAVDHRGVWSAIAWAAAIKDDVGKSCHCVGNAIFRRFDLPMPDENDLGTAVDDGTDAAFPVACGRNAVGVVEEGIDEIIGPCSRAAHAGAPEWAVSARAHEDGDATFRADVGEHGFLIDVGEDHEGPAAGRGVTADGVAAIDHTLDVHGRWRPVVREVPVDIMEALGRQADLPEIVHRSGARSRCTHLADGNHQQCNQDQDQGDDDNQFDYGETQVPSPRNVA